MASARDPTVRQTLVWRSGWLLVVTGFAFIVLLGGFLVTTGIVCLFTGAIVLVQALERSRPPANAANHRQGVRGTERRAA